KPMTEDHPLFSRDEFHQVLLDLFRLLFLCQPQPSGKPCDMSIDDDTFIDAERVSEDDVGRLAPNAIQVCEFLHRARHSPAMFLDQLAATRLDILGFVPEKAGRLDLLLEF